jgi:hypothetical protein
MSTLTITVDDEILRKAELYAKQKGSSVEKLVEEHLATYRNASPETSRSMTSEQEAALKDLEELWEKATSRRGDRRWTRDELHERRG